MFTKEKWMFLKQITKTLSTVALVAGLVFSNLALADEPPVKKSKSGICHAKGSTYYGRTKNYIPYETMEACLKSGGRRPKR